MKKINDIYAICLIINMLIPGISILSAQVPVPVLISPANDAVDVDPLSINFEWSVIDTAVGYQIIIDMDQNFNDPLINTTTATPIIEITELFANWKFYWQVRALFETDTSEWSSIREFTTMYNSAENFSPFDEEEIEDTTSVVLMWQIDLNSALDSIQHNYKVQLSDDNLFNSFIEEDLSDTNSVFINDLIPNTTYFWHVQYWNENGMSDWSHATSFMTNNVPPGIPQLTFPINNDVEVDPINIIFKWDAVDNAQAYNFEVAKDSIFNDILESAAIATSTYTTSVLAYNTKLFWRVQAINEDSDESLWSKIWQFTTSASVPQSPPGLINPSHYMTIEIADSIVFTWNSVYGAEEYNLNISSNNDFTESDSSYLFSDTSAVVFLNLQSGDNLFWRVRAINNLGNGPWSDEFTFFILEIPQTAPQLISLSDSIKIFKADSLFFEWHPVLSAEEYELQLSTDESFIEDMVSMNHEDTSAFVNLNTQPPTQYYWRVRAVNIFGNGPWSETFTFLIDIETSIESPDILNNSFVLHQNYPNPFNPTTNIEFYLSERSFIQIRVYNILGKLVTTLLSDTKNIGSHSVRWDGTNLKGMQTASGIYIYTMSIKTITGKKFLKTNRMVKIQ